MPTKFLFTIKRVEAKSNWYAKESTFCPSIVFITKEEGIILKVSIIVVSLTILISFSLKLDKLCAESKLPIPRKIIIKSVFKLIIYDQKQRYNAKTGYLVAFIYNYKIAK